MNRLPQGCDEIYELSDIAAGCFSLNARGDLALLAGYGDLQVMNLNRPRDPLLRGESRNKWPVLCAKWGDQPLNENFFVTTKSSGGEVWELDSNGSSISCKCSFKGHARQITDVDWRPQVSTEFATTSLDNYTLIWDLRETRKPVISLRSAATVSLVRWSRNKNFLVTAHDTTLSIIDIRMQVPVHSVYAHESKVSSVEWCSVDTSPIPGGQRFDLDADGSESTGRGSSGDYILTGGRDALVKVWHVSPATNTLDCVASVEASNAIWRAKFVPFGFALLAALDDSIDSDNLNLSHGHSHNNLEASRSTMRFWNADELAANQSGRALFAHPERVLDFHFRHISSAPMAGESVPRNACALRPSVASWKLVTWSADRCVRVWKVTKSCVNAMLHAAPMNATSNNLNEALRSADNPRRNTIASSQTGVNDSPSSNTRSATICGEQANQPSGTKTRRVVSGDLPGCDDRVPAPCFCRADFSGNRLVCLLALEKTPIAEQQPSQTHAFARSLAQYEQQAASTHHAVVRQFVVPLSHVVVCDTRPLVTSSAQPAVFTEYRMPHLLSLLFRSASSSGLSARSDRLTVAQFAEALLGYRHELASRCVQLHHCALRNVRSSEQSRRTDLEAVWRTCAALVSEGASIEPSIHDLYGCEQPRYIASPSVGKHVLFRVIERYVQVRDVQTLAAVACFFTALDTLSRYDALLGVAFDEFTERSADRDRVSFPFVEYDSSLLELFWQFEDAATQQTRGRTPSYSLNDRDVQVLTQTQSTPGDSCTPINEIAVNHFEYRTPANANANTASNRYANTNQNSSGISFKLERQCSVEVGFPNITATTTAGASASQSRKSVQPPVSTRKSPSPSISSNDIGSASYTAKPSLAEAQATERAFECEDVRSRSASNQSTASITQSTSRFISRVEAASYVQPRFATLLDNLKLSYFRQLRSTGDQAHADGILKCLHYPLKVYLSASSSASASASSD